MGFFLWGHIRDLIKHISVDSEVDLIACIVETATTFTQ
jgi:hypothetical protein